MSAEDSDFVKQARERLLSIDEEEFASLGVSSLAYVKSVIVDGRSRAYAIYAADGTALGFSDSEEMAMAAIHQSDLFLMSVH